MRKTLRDIFLTYNIDIRDEDGNLRNVVDVLSHIHLRLDKDYYEELSEEISFQLKLQNIFEDEKKKGA